MADVRFGAHSGLKSDIARGPKSAKHGSCRAKKKPPEGGFSYSNLMMDHCHQCGLRLPTIAHEANASEAEKHHCPCGGFGDGGNANTTKPVRKKDAVCSRIGTIDRETGINKSE
jgi:hypothetical protein